MPIPILRLPFLALKVVMDCMENVELLAISLCNKRAERAIKVCRRNPSVFNVDSGEMERFNDLEQFQLLLPEAGNPDIKEKLDEGATSLEVVVSEVISLEFHVGWPLHFKLKIDKTSRMESYKEHKKVLNLDGAHVPCIFTENQFYTFWEDKLQGLKFFVKYFETNFCLEKCYWVFENSVPELKPLVAYLNSLPNETEDGLRVKKVTVASWAELCHSDYKFILESVTHKLKAEMSVSKDFRFTGKYATKKLSLESAHWFTSKHLIDCKCEYLKVEGSKITNKQLNVFIRKWSNGELSHFEEVKVVMKDPKQKKVKVRMTGPTENAVNLDVILKGSKVVRVMPHRCSSNVHRIPPRRMIEDKNGERAVVDGEDQKFVFSKSDE
ncbi:unnamed protein product [Caenorhabditis brenneri]